jgi:hypothetical protein
MLPWLWGRPTKHDAALKSIAMVNEAILRPELWPDALLSIATCCNSTTAHAHMVGAGRYTALTGRAAEGTLQEYFAGGWPERNSRLARGLALTRAGFRGLITERHMFTPEEMARDPFQNEFASAHDIDVEAGMVVAQHGGSSFVIKNCAQARERGLRPFQRIVTGIEKEWVEPPRPAGGAGTRAARTALTAAASNRLSPDERDTRADATLPEAVTTKLMLTVPSMPRNLPTRRAIADRTELCQRAGLMLGAREAFDFCDAVEGLALGVSFATCRSAAFSR